MNQHVIFNDLLEMQLYARRNCISLYAYKNVIYNLTKYIDDNPNCEIYLRNYENQDVTNFNLKNIVGAIHKDIISTLNQYVFGYIQKKDKPVMRFKQSKSIVDSTRKKLKESIRPYFEDIPDDCSIEKLPILRIHQQFYSQKAIKLTQ